MFSGGAPIHLGWSRMFDPKKPTIQKPIDWRRIGKLFAPYWKQELQVLACVGSVSVLGLAAPLVSMWVIDRAIPASDFRLVIILAGLMVASAVLSSLAGVYQGYLNAVVGEGIMRDLRVALLSHLQRMPLDFFTNTKTGEIMNRVSNDVDSINGVVSGTLMSILTNLFVMMTTLVTIFLLDWRLALASLMLLPAMVLPMWPVGRRLYQARSTSREKRDEIHAVEQETLSVSGILLLKSFVREDYERQRFLDLSSSLMNTEVQLAMIGRWFMALIAAMIVIGPACIWLYGGWLCIYHGVTVGTVVSFIALLARLYSPAATLAGVQTQIVSALAVFERIFDYLDMKEESYSRSDTAPLGDIEGEVEFESVTFAYPDGREALKDISFRVKPGQLAAFVGPSGAGKTTISMLVPRFYEPQSGEIRIDGRDVKSVGLSDLRSNIGIVSQETYLFHDTVMNNLRYARPDASPEMIMEATKAANIHDLISRLALGYDTVVGERGHKLSGGERQRLAIARALLKDPKVLILDEATSSLDSENEALIQTALVPLMKGRTSLVIAHRLSTIHSADVIFVLHEGQIIDSGNHKELMERQGLYARLYQQQFKEAPSSGTNQ